MNVKLVVMLTWGEDVWVEANVKGRVADGAHRLTGMEDHLTTCGICLCLGNSHKY